MIRTILASTAAAAVMLSGAGPAAAAGTGRAKLAAGTQLTLTYMADAGYATAVVLRCNPPGGAHPKPVRACNTLKRVDGKPANLKPARTMCMMIYAPITAQITGIWRGKKVAWSQKYGNTCVMNRATGVLFQF